MPALNKEKGSSTPSREHQLQHKARIWTDKCLCHSCNIDSVWRLQPTEHLTQLGLLSVFIGKWYTFSLLLPILTGPSMSVRAGQESPWKLPFWKWKLKSSRQSLTIKERLKFQLYDTQEDGGDSSVYGMTEARDLDKESVPGRGDSTCKGPAARWTTMQSRNWKKVGVPGAQKAWGLW